MKVKEKADLLRLLWRHVNAAPRGNASRIFGHG